MEENTNLLKQKESSIRMITPDVLHDHWQGHRHVTRRLIEVFPEDKFFTYSIGGMRPCSGLIMEMIRLSALGVNGIVTGDWKVTDQLRKFTESATPGTKLEILALWDEVTMQIQKFFSTVKPSGFNETVLSFGLYETPVYGSILYWIDNEVHHRGQAYVYLRSLGIEPPPFWERG
jgi:uncharacterized damage-inducible protein DinB